jgi:hypothetical protein
VRKEVVVEDKERLVPGTEETDDARREDVEGHRLVPDADEARRETDDDDPDVEGHRIVPGSERGRTTPRTEL